MSERDVETATAPTAGGSAGTTYRVQHTGSEPLSITLVTALSECVGIDPMEFQLYDYVDPDALDALFEPLCDAGEADGRVELQVLEHRAVIYSTGEIEISPQDVRVPDAGTRRR